MSEFKWDDGGILLLQLALNWLLVILWGDVGWKQHGVFIAEFEILISKRWKLELITTHGEVDQTCT
jgi:hypothetical protein